MDRQIYHEENMKYIKSYVRWFRITFWIIKSSWIKRFLCLEEIKWTSISCSKAAVVLVWLLKWGHYCYLVISRYIHIGMQQFDSSRWAIASVNISNHVITPEGLRSSSYWSVVRKNYLEGCQLLGIGIKQACVVLWSFRSAIARQPLPNHLPPVAWGEPSGFRAPTLCGTAWWAHWHRFHSDWSTSHCSGHATSSLHLQDTKQGRMQCCSTGMEQLESYFASFTQNSMLC